MEENGYTNKTPPQNGNTAWSDNRGGSNNYPHGDVFSNGYKRLTSGTKVATPDANNNIALNDDNIHIQPVNNGFMVTINREEGITVDCFNDFNDVLTFLKENDILDIDTKKVADNI